MLRVMPETRGRGTGSTAFAARRWREMRWMSSGRKPETGEPCAWKRASTVREGAERNVLKGNALAAYFTRKMELWCARRWAVCGWWECRRISNSARSTGRCACWSITFSPPSSSMHTCPEATGCGGCMMLPRRPCNVCWPLGCSRRIGSGI